MPKINFSKLIFVIFFLFNLIIISCLIAPFALATELQLQIPIGDRQSFTVSGSTIGEYIQAIIVFASGAIISLAIVMIIVGGIQWIISGGVPNKISNAKNTILKAFLGMFIAIFAVFILETINPNLVQFKSLSPKTQEKLPCCEYSESGSKDKLYNFMSEEKCLNKKPPGKIVNNSQCLNN
ncbi:MAG: hypothetical protein GF365_01170|nr:hypothetical protein [Candidatus Buchananbacteria bacterium]